MSYQHKPFLAIAALFLLSQAPAKSDDPGASAVNPNKMRALRSGQFHDYVWSYGDGERRIAGTAKVTFGTTQVSGQTLFVINAKYTPLQKPSVQLRALVDQKADRSVELVSFNSPAANPSETPRTPFTFPGYFRRGMEFDYALNLGEGTELQFHLTTQRLETIRVRGREYRAWKATSSANNTDRPAITVWFSPEIGGLVKAQGRFLDYSATIELTNYR